VVTGVYEDNSTATLAITPADVSGYDANTTGEQTLTVTLQGKTATFTVTVNEPAALLSSIAITTPPTKSTYIKGEALDLTGLVVTGIYEDNSTVTLAVTPADVSGYDANITGEQTLTVTLQGKTATFTVTVNELTGIAVTTPPAKTAYNKGEALDLTGLVVTGGYSDGSTAILAVTPADVSGYDANITGEQTLTVTLQDKTATFTVTVNELTGIAVTTPPAKTAYNKGEALDLTGLVVIGTYSDGSSKVETVTLADVSGYKTNTTGQQTLTVTINGKTTTFTVTVNGTITDINAISAYLGSAKGGTDANNPVALALNVNLSGNGLTNVLSAISSAGKFVALDLSGSTMSGTEFDSTSGAGAAKVVSLVLPDTAKSIKAGTYFTSIFSAFTNLKSVSGAGVETVDDNVFRDCTSLSSVSLPNAQTIGNEAFRYCTSLSSVNLPEVTTIGNFAFYECTSLTSVNLPEVTTIGNYAFYKCTSLTSVNLPNVTTIDGRPFARCSNLTSITVDAGNTKFSASGGMLLNKAGTTLIAYPSATDTVTLTGITAIGDDAFEGCRSLSSVSLPNAQTIGAGAFQGCDSLSSVSLPAVTSIGIYAFERCRSLSSVSMPNVQTIEENAFNNCDSLSSVSLPNVQTIGNGAFYYCDNLTTVNLPAVTSIGDYAFEYCESLSSVSLPASLTTIDGKPFARCSNLTSITVDAGNTKFSASGGMLLDKAGTTLIAYPSATGTVTLTGITAIDNYAFYYNRNITSVSMPAVTSIGIYAFSRCDSLSSVSLPATPPTIQKSTPYMDSSIFSYTGPSGTITITVPSEAVSAYSGWTATAGGNTAKYGDNHKAVTIEAAS
jgi:hypothetical protein